MIFCSLCRPWYAEDNGMGYSQNQNSDQTDADSEAEG